tara:strand:- start:3195 stop:5042 length:1848 start_codon:yes stop_codon:yes gene_type:complete
MVDHLAREHGYAVNELFAEEIEEAILNLEVMPSMRAMMTAGFALGRDNVVGYNCSYLPVDSPRAFDECMYILMCGTGVGFSVEDRYVSKLPIVNEHFEDSSTIIRVGDSRSGWARAFRELVSLLYVGQIPSFDVSDVRPAGARLSVMGGRASGPDPLLDLFKFVTDIFKTAAGRRLTALECHDIMCKVGEIVVVGGVRRSALISLSDLSNREISHAKSGNWWENNGQRALANNSVSYDKKPDVGTFMKEWLSLYDSKSGERGIFNREAAKMKVSENGRRDAEHEFGCNPCSEIILRPYQFCNLSEVVVRPTDSLDDLKRKVRIATTLGTFQSTLTNFKYLRKIWEKNTKEERLLGVSLTGIMDHNVLSKTVDSVRWLREMKQAAVDQNAYLAGEIGIEASTAITCVKPSGTVSQLVDAASGIHARHNPHYVRTVRGDNKDPLTQFLVSKGVPNEPDVMKPDTTTVFSFLTRSPDTSSCRNDMTALEQLELWKLYAIHWCEHKPSVTISVKEHEWIAVGAWVYDNFDLCSGISFLPFSDHTYKQAPYQDITKKEYDGGYQLVKDQDGKENKMNLTCPPDLNWVDLEDFEKQDNTNGNRELACSADACEVVDIGAVQ